LFDDTEGSQKVVLGSGSNRGAISLSANSPTNALVQADYVNILNYSSTSLNSGLSKILTGHEHLINADNSKVIKAAAILQAAKTATQVTNNASTVNDSNNTDQYKESEMVSKVNGLIDLGMNDIFTAVSNYYLIQGLISESPFLPHRNLLTLETSDTGAKSSWKSKTADTATVIAAVGIFGNLFNATTAAVTAAKNSKDMEAANNYDDQLANTEKKIQDTQNTLSSKTDLLNKYQADMDKKSDDYDDAVKNNKPSSEQAKLKNDYEASKATYEGQAAAVNATKDALSKLTSQYNDLLALQASSEARTLKRLSAGAAIGSNLTTVIGQILAVITTSLALYSKLGEPEGILVNSKDSYVNVKANTYASVSGYGPVIIESTNTPISDFLRLGLYDGQRPVLPITPELPKNAAPAGFANYTHTKAVVLSSNLVRAMAQEVSLVSGGAIVGKAEDQIQLIAGVATADVANQSEADARRTFAAEQRNIVAMAETDALKDAANAALYDNALTYLNIPDRISADRALNKGILIKTQGQATPLYLQTAEQDSPIEITQGTDPVVVPASSRSIRLSSDGTTVQDGTNVKLELKDTSGAATLQVSPATSVKMSPDKVAIAANASVSIDLSSTDIDLSAANQISLSTGGNKIVLSQAGVKITSGSVTVDVLPACLQLAS
jgi:hypothetical protein